MLNIHRLPAAIGEDLQKLHKEEKPVELGKAMEVLQLLEAETTDRTLAEDCSPKGWLIFLVNGRDEWYHFK